jgi:RNA polymerase sigma-70 factor, ECF subfamily
MGSALTGCYKSSTNVETDSDILNTIARHRLLFIAVSGLRHSLGSSLWSFDCLAYFAAEVERVKAKVQSGFLATLICLERDILIMSAMEMVIERERSVHPGFFAERVQELDNVVSRYRPLFYKRAFHFLRNATDAEDAVQDGLLSAYKHLGQFRGQAKLSTWLTTIVINAARMRLRRHRGDLSLDQEHGQDGLLFSEQLADSRPSPEEVCSAVEARDRLVEGVQRLSPKLRRVFQLRDIDGLTTKEAAHVLSVPQGTVKARLARAHAQLRGIVRVKHVRRRSRTVLRSKEVSTKGRSENWLWEDAGGKLGTSSLPEEAK